MTFTLQPIRWPDDDQGDIHDFRVLNDGKRVGRIYRRNAARESWNWGIYGGSCGIADTLEGAKAAFRKAWNGDKARAMTGDEVKQIRLALGAAKGRKVAKMEFAELLGLSGSNGEDTVRAWEVGRKEVSGPVALARLIGQTRPGLFAFKAGAADPTP